MLDTKARGSNKKIPTKNVINYYKNSVKGCNWQILEVDDQKIIRLNQKFGINDILAKIMIARNINTDEEIVNFLDPKIRNILPNPFLLKDIHNAIDRIIEAMNQKQQITIFGDYDVDGATSSALLRRYFNQLNVDNDVYIPHRINEGYGPNKKALSTLYENGSKLVITVDCGTLSFEPLEHAAQIGLDVIIIDHHLGAESLPKAFAVINPNRIDEDFEFKDFAAVGVAYLVLIALNSTLRAQNWFEKNNLKEPDLLQMLDLVALGTVCDVMPLKHINRAFVYQGLKIMAKRNNVGITALAKMINLDTKPRSSHLGFAFGPRINAGGRVGQGYLGTNLLTTNDKTAAYEIATELEKLNQERKTIEALILKQVNEQIEQQQLYKNSFIVVAGEGWHIGILGILASRIKEKYSKPTAIISINNNIGKGSGRSIEGIDLGSAIFCAKQDGLLIEGGGHKMAGGFTIEQDKIKQFTEYVDNIFKKNQDNFRIAKEILVDAKVDLMAINKSLIQMVEQSEPFGQCNPQPRFMIEDVIIYKATMVGIDHISVILMDKSSDKKIIVKAIAFKARNNALGDFLLSNIGKKASFIGNAQLNYCNHEKVDFIIEDAIKTN